MQTIGVIGGIGPQATIDFESRVYRAARARTPGEATSGFPRLVVWLLNHPPLVVTESGLPSLPLTPHPGLLDAAQSLGTVADFLVMTSNGAHVFRGAVERASGKPVVSLIDSTIAEVQRRGWTKVGVLGLGEPVVYLEPLGRLGIATTTIDVEMRGRLDPTIFRLMSGETGYELGAAAREAVATLRAQDIDGVILGCTEIPLLLAADSTAPDLIDPMDYFIDVVLDRAMGNRFTSAA